MNKTVKVRIAVCVDPQGDWSSSGWSGATDEDMMENASGDTSMDAKQYFIEAEIPIPEPEIVQGTVSPAAS